MDTVLLDADKPSSSQLSSPTQQKKKLLQQTSKLSALINIHNIHRTTSRISIQLKLLPQQQDTSL